MTTKEKDWLRRYRAGEQGTFDEFYDRYGVRVYRFCRRLSLSTTDAEDLTQETFVSAFQSLHRFEGRSSLTTWLFRIAYYQWRGQKNRQPEIVPLDDEREMPDPSTVSKHEGTHLDLQDAISTLPHSWKAALLLVKVEGLTCKEAAEVLDLPIGTVKYHVHQAMVRLKEHLGMEKGSTPPSKLIANESLSQRVCDEM